MNSRSDSRFCSGVIRFALAGLIIGATLSVGASHAAAQEKFPAITAWDTNTYGGGFDIHWGDLSSKGSVVLPNPLVGKLSNSLEDPWLRVRTEGTLYYSNTTRYANGQYSSGYSTTPILSTEPHYFQPYLNAIPTAPQNYEHLYQHQSITLPDYEYAHWKDVFLSKNLPYYWADISGDVWGTDPDPASPTYGQIILQPFDDWFSVFPTDPDYWHPYLQYAFIDTIDQQPPAADKSNMALVQSQAGQTHSRGLLFVANDVEFKGNANPVVNQDILDADGNPFVVMPDGTVAPDTTMYINHRGFFLSWGEIQTSGKRTVYGAVFGEQNFSGSGLLSVWYDYRIEGEINAIDVPVAYVSFATTTSMVSESIGTTTVTVTLDHPADPLWTYVDYAVIAGGTAVSPDDYSLLGTGTLEFAPGVVTQDVLLSIVDDSLLESPETVLLQLSNPINAHMGSPDTHTLTIIDNEPTPTPSPSPTPTPSLTPTDTPTATPTPTPVCDQPGDENHDCAVDLGEVNQAILAFRGEIPPPSSVDTDGNGVVSVDELNAVIGNYRGDIPPVTPEPSITPTPSPTPAPTPAGPCDLPGDENNDCVVDLDEMTAVLNAYRDPVSYPAPPSADTDGNGVIDQAELDAVLDAYSNPLPTLTPVPTPTPSPSPTPTPIGGCGVPGDENGDCVIDLQELNAVVAAYRYGDPAPPSADTDGNGVISVSELNAVMLEYRANL
ncbi:hypothetical protein KQI84_01195 [bacterium]|nr:hypothetical protein [bacterium]